MRGGGLVDRGRQVAGLGCEVKEDGGFVELDRYILMQFIRHCTISRTKITNLGRLTLSFLLVVYMKQSQLWHRSLVANPAGALPSSEHRRNPHNTDTGDCQQSEWRSAAVSGDLEVHVSWIVAWRNESSSLVYQCAFPRSQHQTILR